MGALTLGPLVLSLDRAAAGLGFAVLLVGAEWLARRGRPELAEWSWQVALVTFLGARAGWVLGYLDVYLERPASILAIWQGGFAPWWGVAAGAAYGMLALVRRPQLRRVATKLSVGALASWWLAAGLLSASEVPSDVRVPAVVLEALEGEPVALAALGRPSIVNVWATWCPPCRREMPVLVTAAERNPEVAVLLVNQRESPATVRGYLEREGFPTTGVLLDPRGVTSAALGVAGFPTTLAFDADGRLVDVHVGEISAAALAAMIARVR